MNYGLYLSASGVLTNMHRQDVASANLANVSTVGFKRSMSELAGRDPESRRSPVEADLADDMLDRLGGGVWARPTRVDLRQGALEPTGADFDIALDGPGFFVVRDTRGGESVDRLTRDGRLTAGPDGYLVTTTNAAKVLDENGQPISLNLGLPLAIDQHGRVRQAGAEIARIRTVNVGVDQVRHAGHGMFDVEDRVLAGAQPAAALVRQGHVERSNADAIREMLELMSAGRAISANANLIRYHDSVMDRAVNTLGRVA